MLLASSLFWAHAKIALLCPLGVRCSCGYALANEMNAEVMSHLRFGVWTWHILFVSAIMKADIKKQSPSVWVLMMDIQSAWEITLGCFKSLKLQHCLLWQHNLAYPNWYTPLTFSLNCKLLVCTTVKTCTKRMSTAVVISLLSWDLPDPKWCIWVQ